MRVIFVGLHNKPKMKPLDSKTKSGRLIDKIIDELPSEIVVQKSNLFNLNGIPNIEFFYKSRDEWYNAFLPTSDDIIVLLGAMTQKEFIHNPQCRGLVKIAHPASKRSHEQMNDYVLKAVEKIKYYFKKKGAEMKNIPKKIYLQIDSDCQRDYDFNELYVTWCTERISKNDLVYYRKPPVKESLTTEQTCKWNKSILTKGYIVPACCTCAIIDNDMMKRNYIYCPFCGKKIERS